MEGEYLISNPADLDKPPFQGRDFVAALRTKQRPGGDMPTIVVPVSRRSLFQLWREVRSLFLWVEDTGGLKPALITHIDAGNPRDAEKVDGAVLGSLRGERA